MPDEDLQPEARPADQPHEAQTSETAFEFRFDGSRAPGHVRSIAPKPIAEEEPSTHPLTILIPARNEEENLPNCLASLIRQSEPGFQLGEHFHILVIDDNSTDGTLAIAQKAAAQYPGIHALQAKHFQPQRRGITGKNAALWFGASHELAHTAKWLLFTDADTIHEPNSASRAVVEAERHELASL